MPRAALPLVLVLALSSPAAGARWDLTPSFPWTYSVNGTEVATAMVLDEQDAVFVAGNVTNGVGADTGRDVLAIMYTRTQTLVAWTPDNPPPVFSSTMYDRAGLDEGEPALAVHRHRYTTGPRNEEYLVFTSTGLGRGELTTWRITGNLDKSSTAPWFENVYGEATSGAGVCVSGSGTPFSVGWVTANGVDQLFYIRQVRDTSTAETYTTHVSATFWSGSFTLSVNGRAIVNDPSDNVWIAAQSGGDLVLFKYLSDYFQDVVSSTFIAKPAPGWPRRYATPEIDLPCAARRDVTGDIWVAGAIGSDGAVWRFDEEGNPRPGFPVRFSNAQPTVFRALVVDDLNRCFVTGSSGPNAIVAGWDSTGAALPGLPFLLPAGADSADGRGIGLDRDSAIWVAATITAAPGTWGGTRIDTFRFAFVPDPPGVAPGEVKIQGPEGAVLNISRAQTMRILAWPPGAGSLVVMIRNLRGELIRRLESAGPGHVPVTLEWDGTNAAGQPVASGTYAAVVTGGGLKVTKRIVVVRRP